MRIARSFVVVSCVLAALLSGCSSDKNTAAKLPTPQPVDTTGDPAFGKAIDALAAATSFHAQTEPSQSAPIPTDIHFGQGGSSASLHATGVDVDIVSDRTNVYVKGPAAFWAANLPSTVADAPTKTALLAAKWVKIDPTQSGLASYTQFSDKAKFLAQFRAQPVHYGLGGKDTVGGESALILNGSNGSKWWVQDGGDGRVLKTSAGSTSFAPGGAMLFTDYNVPFTPPLPTASDVVDYKVITG